MIKHWFYKAAVIVSLTVSLAVVILGACAIVAMQHGITEMEEQYVYKHYPQDRNAR